MKYFKAFLVVSLIFVFPAVSYLYLRSGFIFRKEALEDLKSEIPLTVKQRSFLLETDSTFFDTKDKLVNVYMKINSQQDESDLYFLAESFKPRNDFSVTAIYEKSNLPSFQDTLFSNIINRVDAAEFIEFFSDTTRLMLSKDELIRKKYGHSQEDFNLAYEHIVILLPMKKRDKLTLIREDEK